MVSVEKAKALLLKNVGPAIKTKMRTEAACGYILAEDVFSPVDLPPFNQSAMDGYAVKGKGEKGFRISGEIKAGDSVTTALSSGNAVRIFTGAPVPIGADCVVMQEQTSVDGNQLFVGGKGLERNGHIRKKGSHIKKGALALRKGSVLNPAAIGFLASLGVVDIPVFARPRVAIIITGNELVLPGEKLKAGQIFESNSYTLRSALSQFGISPVCVEFARDNKEDLSEKIKTAVSENDLVIISGGISVGKYDLVKDCLRDNGVGEIFYKVAQKPGKPLFVGKSGNKIIFALPGNPAATLVCFYEYLVPAIRKMCGYRDFFLQASMMKLMVPVTRKGDRALFLKGKTAERGVFPLPGQESNIMKSFAGANCLIFIPAGKKNSTGIKRNKERVGNAFFKKGQMVEVHLLQLNQNLL